VLLHGGGGAAVAVIRAADRGDQFGGAGAAVELAGAVLAVLALDPGWPGSEADDRGDRDPAGAVDGSPIAAAVAARARGPPVERVRIRSGGPRGRATHPASEPIQER
jgi:hypothetical protein